MSQSPIGGKLQVFSASLPTLGAGALKDRDDPKLFGTAKVCLRMDFGQRCLLVYRNQTSSNQQRHSTRRSLSIAQGVKYLSTCSYSLAHTKILLLSVRIASRHSSILFGSLHYCNRLSTSLYCWPDILLPWIQRCSPGGCTQVCT